MLDPFIGSIVLFAGTYAPEGWAFCDGSMIQIRYNQALFAVIGTNYGGDGQNTFALPDLRSRVPLGFGQGPGLTNYVIGAKEGTELNSLIVQNLPGHTHDLSGTVNGTISVQMKVNSAAGGVVSPSGAYLGVDSSVGAASYASSTNGSTLAGDAISGAISVDFGNGHTGATGAGVPVENRQPSIALNYIIALQGIFPTRP